MTALIDEGMELAKAADEAGIKLRLLGGVGVVAHCPDALAGKPHREIADIDVAVTRRDARKLTPFLESRGYTAESRFNALHGDTRMIFHGPQGKLDVFVGSFSMCHELDIDDRLALDFPTLTATDLLLTKLQIVELNAKDAHDASVLLGEHELGEGDGDHIDAAYVARLTGDDWGLWRTVTETLRKLSDLHPPIADRTRALSARLDAAPEDAQVQAPRSRRRARPLVRAARGDRRRLACRHAGARWRGPSSGRRSPTAARSDWSRSAPTEQHGPHLPTGTDTIIATGLCERAGERTRRARAARRSPWACSYGHGTALPGTLSLTPETAGRRRPPVRRVGGRRRA